MDTPVKGFVLTSQWRDGPRGLALTFWLVTADGPVRVRVGGERAVMFVERGVAAQADDRKELQLETLSRQPVDALYFGRRGALLDERERLRGQGVNPLESDIRPPQRYLMERFVTGGCLAWGDGRQREGYLDLVAASVKPSDFRPTLSYLSVDIETDGAAGQLLSVALANDTVEEVLMVGEGPAAPGLRYLDDERTLLEAFFDRVLELDPDALIGWNIVDFDLTHLQRRARHHELRLRLGRGGEHAVVLPPRNETQLPQARLPGRVALDGINLLKAATYSFERFTLQHVAQQLLGRGKAITETTDPVEEIRRLYREDKPALARYNLEDCRLVSEIFDKTDLLSFAVERQQMTGLPMDRVGGSVAAFDHLYLPRLHRRGFVAPDVGATPSGLISPGGYVLASRPGLYHNVLVLDFKSLYPSIIRTFKIDPLGLHLAGDDAIEGFDGGRFDREQHILPELIASLWERRDQAKKAADQPLSRAIKIVMNSFYGVLGTPGCRFFNPKLVSSITRRGHEIITRSRDWLTEQGREVIYGDTDSLFVAIGGGSGEGSLARALEVGRELMTELNRWWQERIREEHQTDSELELELEVCYARFLMPTLRGSEQGSAKRYAGWLADERRLVVKGLEAVRSDWTDLARSFQRKLLEQVFHDEPVEDYVRQTRDRLFAGALDEQLVYRKRLRRGIDSYQHNVPPHVKAARLVGRPLRDIAYVWTTRGPQPLEAQTATLDYHHYVDKQLAPAADVILSCLGTSFDAIAGAQLRLF
jgi:DNA polymerase-2